MPEFETTRRVRHTAENMFELVADVENYPKFLPLCQAARLRGKKVVSPSCDVIVADMTVAYKVIRETFTSRATLNRGDMAIEVEYLDGPFKYLHNRWKFDDLPGHNCDVAFFISYEFRSRMLSAVMGAVFDKAFRMFATAFENRADELYGIHDAKLGQASPVRP
ncbi:coenzyme Q-binding protein COQ10 [Rhodobium orientis]|uniref:Ubiquinone-binding protein n=1 Tax=Rhodobium orientis TaxID=34017 RepID=A0A327JT12_9HYPH|nr:type II toxin-antitoxin system RatA family toxin [Rhodobium orientis]MBB4302464.1 coenzyme Q-binding protein COQ10 [Rhodobium orientis]MBK5949313.1 ubiquinone-binding protein [Rhodobium orientis]RAI28636.1 ubiquinone-binding protein [Rhodobium orientis]